MSEREKAIRFLRFFARRLNVMADIIERADDSYVDEVCPLVREYCEAQKRLATKLLLRMNQQDATAMLSVWLHEGGAT